MIKEVDKVTYVRKRDGRLVPFNKRKIAEAIFKAAKAVGGENRELADELAEAVSFYLHKKYSEAAPNIEEIQDMAEKILVETGHTKTAKAYILYRDARARKREELKVRKKIMKEGDSTDLALMVSPSSKDQMFNWDRSRIALALIREARMPQHIAEEIAAAVEKKIFNSGLSQISTSLIRELVDNELFIRGFNVKLKAHSIIGMPVYDLDRLITSKSNENSNIATNNPEAINLSIAETTLKQYALEKVFSEEVAEAHLRGQIHLHDLGYPTRVYCSSHSLEYLKKYGLQLGNLDTSSGPAKHARTLTGHLNTFLASMQAYYAGALGVGYINIFYAPYLEGLSYEEMKQEAQYLIFSGSQNAFSRGGQTLFLDFNIHTGIPNYMKNIPAIGPGGKYTDKTYKDYEKESRMFARAMLEIWEKGDSGGRVFAFPKCDFHINKETFEDPEQLELLKYACEIASRNGTPYFIFDRDEVTLSACCRLRTQIKDNYMIQHPESMRFCGFQNVTVNLPRAAFQSGRGNTEKFFKEVEKSFGLCVKAHLEKREFIEGLMAFPGAPLWEVGKTAMDGKPYIELDKCTYIVGLVGLNEATQYILGKELHEGEDALKFGLKVVANMYFLAKKAEQKYGLKFSLEESPAESATRRLAKVDMQYYPEAKQYVKGDFANDEYYYTNSIHLRADADIDIVTRIENQAKFHTMIESGAIIHAFVGEKLPSPESVLNLVKKTYHKTQAAQLTISPEFTVCRQCRRSIVGIREECQSCAAIKIPDVTAVNDMDENIKWKQKSPGKDCFTGKAEKNQKVSV
ncbi:MAG: anaerobic ribonucleoside-triphosphate reductase [bacterium]|nr:anaerobic ribonucleoside-triphosphate reductase [bacterium]